MAGVECSLCAYPRAGSAGCHVSVVWKDVFSGFCANPILAEVDLVWGVRAWGVPGIMQPGALILGVRPPKGAWRMTVTMRCCQPSRGSALPGEACDLYLPPPIAGLVSSCWYWLWPVAPSLALGAASGVRASAALWAHCAVVPTGPAAQSLMISTPSVPSSWRRALSVR